MSLVKLTSLASELALEDIVAQLEATLQMRTKLHLEVEQTFIHCR